jgi:hypothetical protein
MMPQTSIPRDLPRRLTPGLLAAFLCVALAGGAHAAIIYVDGESTALLPDGSQEAPFRTIQDGINAGGPQDQVHVAPGVYNELVVMKDGVDLIGAGADVTIINGSDRGGRVVTFNGTRFNPRLEGFTITGGEGEVVDFINNIPITVGGAIGIFASGPVITDNVITGNSVTDGYVKGGAIYIIAVAEQPQIFGNVISGNVALSDVKREQSRGGGIYINTKSGRVLITDNVIESNQSVYGGGIYSSNITDAEVTIARNLIRYNQADEGAAILSQDFELSSTTIVNNTLVGNGTSAGVVDCDDNEALSSPALEEICNDGIDNDCDPSTPDIFDGDSDGVLCDVDCDDSSPTVFPGAAEHCSDQIDNDCDGQIDWSDPDNLVLVEFGSPMVYLSNSSDPGIGLDWVAAGYDDSGWDAGTYGVGFEGVVPGAEALLQTIVPSDAASVYTRTTFDVEFAAQVNAIFVAADYDDGYVVWINGTEAYRSPEMPAGDPAWNTVPTSHEASNGPEPDYGTLNDISVAALGLLVDGENELAIAVYNDAPGVSSDMVLVPRLSISYGSDDADCLCADADSDSYACDDCDDSEFGINPGVAEVCNDGIDNDCNVATDDIFDLDGDGYLCAADCDETNPNVNPGVAEVVCDNLDNDCNPGTEDVVDADSDFFDCFDDCNDSNPAIKPTTVEFCFDGVDNNCDGFIDDDDLECSCGSPVDLDSDGFRCTDCDDTEPLVNPSRTEICNDGLDNDCNVSTPDLFDGDSDGYSCELECDDFDPTVNPDGIEICNDGKDNDCDGNTDELDTEDCGCPDNDSDGYACLDCNDGDATVNPAMAEVCNDSKDNDCDGSTPDIFDGDGDGVDCDTDCRDDDPEVYPGAFEQCTDGVDNDCNGLVDLATLDLALVEFGSSMRYLANNSDPGLGLTWVAESFNDSSWANGVYGVGYQVGPPNTGADDLILTDVTDGTTSVYTRARFTITEVSAISAIYIGADYDDGYVAWINGTEVYRSPEMPAGDPAWNTDAAQHESSNAEVPDYGTLIDITTIGLPLLQNGINVLAVGLYNDVAVPASSDLVVVPRLSMDFGSDDPDCLCNDYDSDGYACSDCNDFIPFVNPGADEVGCDLRDNDCDEGTPDILDADSDGYACDVDCLDNDPNANPGATEIGCDFVDNDCNQVTSDVIDADSDLYDCLVDCDDANPDVNPGVAEVYCDNIDNDCSTLTADVVDEDGDGYNCNADCNDGDAAISPDGAEKCDDGVDNDCDDLTDGDDTADCSCADADSDGYQCLDCNDGDASVNPGQAEICSDTIDNDCDPGTPDVFDLDGDGSDCLADCDDNDLFVRPNAVEICNDQKDNDCNPATLDIFDTDGDTFTCDVDCNDQDPTINPGQPDVCNDGIDNDCNPSTLDIVDEDSDGSNCVFDCDETDDTINPGVAEVCNDGIDNDCNPLTPDLFDADSDGVTCETDCDDNDAARFQGNYERCDDGIDNDCDVDVDGADVADCSCGDADSDGYSCFDCLDSDPLSYPGALEICNDTLDNDCDAGTLDVDDLDSDGYLCTSDCNDYDASVNTAAIEICGDALDNDCNAGTPDVWDDDSDGYDCSVDCDETDNKINPGRPELGCDGLDNDCDPATSDLADIDGDEVYCTDITVRGGGVSATSFSTGQMFIINNTIVENSVPLGIGGGVWVDDLLASVPGVVANNVIYGNIAQLGGGLDHTAFFGKLHNNALYANTTGDYYNGAGSTASKQGNIFVDPQLASIPNGNFRPVPGSPVIDAADPNYAPLSDQDRFWRPYDGDGDLTAVADIGAFEYPSGEVFNLVFTAPDLLEWEVRAEDQAFNLYRGALSKVKAQGVYTQNPFLAAVERWCYIDPLGLPVSDPYVPGPGAAVVYLVTTTTAGFEGTLGFDSDNGLRPNDNPCP